MQVQFAKEYRHPLSALAVQVYPAGWRGEVSEAVAEAAAKAGALRGGPAGDDAGDAGDGGLAGKSVAELRDLAAAEGIDLAGATRKAEVIAAIEAGRAGS